jgi:RNA polymerase sigma-70 factor (ECF subfamily)
LILVEAAMQDSSMADKPKREAEGGAKDKNERWVCESAHPASAASSEWAALIARYNRRVMVALLAEKVPIDRARDIAQETWTKLMEKHASGALAELKLPGLAIVQAIFLARDEMRRAQRRPEAPLPDVADDHDSAERRLVSREEVAAALLALNRLPAKSRRVFQLAYENERFTHQQIAQRVSLSEQRVRQILCEIRKSLRAAVKEPS